jgi:hypothetical protein
MTLLEVVAFLEAEPIEKSWKETIASQASDESIRRIAAEAGEFMLNSPPPVAEAISGTVLSRLSEEARAARGLAEALRWFRLAPELSAFP